MPLIGLTGSIGSGKSTASRYLAGLGAVIIDADLISREAVKPGAESSKRIEERFGRDVFFKDGALNRKMLADMIFADENKRKALNDILHPVIADEMFKRAEEQIKKRPDSVVVLVAPLLIETGMHKKVDSVWLITADNDAVISRIMERDGCTRAQAQRRLASQMPESEKRLHSDVIFENDKGIGDLHLKLKSAFDAISRQ